MESIAKAPLLGAAAARSDAAPDAAQSAAPAAPTPVKKDGPPVVLLDVRGTMEKLADIDILKQSAYTGFQLAPLTSRLLTSLV